MQDSWFKPCDQPWVYKQLRLTRFINLYAYKKMVLLMKNDTATKWCQVSYFKERKKESVEAK